MQDSGNDRKKAGRSAQLREALRANLQRRKQPSVKPETSATADEPAMLRRADRLKPRLDPRREGSDREPDGE